MGFSLRPYGDPSSVITETITYKTFKRNLLKSISLDIGVMKDKRWPRISNTGKVEKGILSNKLLAEIHARGVKRQVAEMVYGSIMRNVPPRPFMSIGLHDAVKTREFHHLISLIKIASLTGQGKSTNIKPYLERLGKLISDHMVDVINSGDRLAPIKDSTLANRLNRGIEDDRPLLETGELRNSIGYRINGPG